LIHAPGTSTRDVLLWRSSTPLTRSEFLRDAASLAAQLPPGTHLLNLCEQREPFLLTFAASLLARRIQLMPSARGEIALRELRAAYPDCLSVTDDDVRRWRTAPYSGDPAPELAPDHGDVALVGFTSGSTGRAQPHAKRWRTLSQNAALDAAAIRRALTVSDDVCVSIVATVPPHHMYGIEFTVLLPLFKNMSIHGERPLFPADVAEVLAESASPRVLVSTPLHLRALADSGIDFPVIDLIVSATAPLDPALARVIESRLRAPLLEMFGSTETGAFASRRTVRDQEWRLYAGVTLETAPDSTSVSADWFDGPQRLQDVFERRGPGGFVLLGRDADLVEVAGKRASLADIARRICAVDGVEDAVAFQPEAAASGVASRVAAVVVSRGASARQIADQLAASVDAAFVPRPLVLVDRIPRDPVGKISRAQLLELTRGRSPLD
jgi:acyl-coenzyme A synthetase/AMP-(fatty) acid ligase